MPYYTVRLTDIIDEEMKLNHVAAPRAVRQWKKDVRSSYSALVQVKEKLLRRIKGRKDEE